MLDEDENLIFIDEVAAIFARCEQAPRVSRSLRRSSAIEARSDATGTSAAEGESAAPKGGGAK